MATHSSVLAWTIPETAEPGGLPSMGSHRVGHDQSNLAAAAAFLVANIYLVTAVLDNAVLEYLPELYFIWARINNTFSL